MNFLSILYFLSHRQDIATVLSEKQELRSFLDSLKFCSTCSMPGIRQPHLQLVHYARLVDSNLDSSKNSILPPQLEENH
jgi:hypothetical protein